MKLLDACFPPLCLYKHEDAEHALYHLRPPYVAAAMLLHVSPKRADDEMDIVISN
jgi:hypothetical protein